MFVTILLLMVIIASGFLTKMPKESKFLLPKAVLLTGGGTIIAMLFFTLIFTGLTFTNVLSLLFDGVASLFIIVLLIAVIDGFLLYWVGRLVARFVAIPTRLLTMSEYIIQWSLIYITVYQVLYDNIFPEKGGDLLQNLSISNPSAMMVAVLPSLISVWIAVILFKVKENSI